MIGRKEITNYMLADGKVIIGLTNDGRYKVINNDNNDDYWKDYQLWLSKGNTPLPAIAPPVFSTPRGERYKLVSSDYTLSAKDNLIVADASKGAIALSLPPAQGNIGVDFTIKKIDSTTNAVKVVSTETIDGLTTRALTTQNAYLLIKSTDINWIIL